MLSTASETHYDASHQMYENMQSEKKTAGGPAVLNLATGVPQPHDISPTNPVYSQITDVPQLNQQEPRPQAHVNVISQGDTVAYEVPLPMQGQHVTRSADSVGGARDKDRVDLTRNEAYGLIRWTTLW